LPAEVFINNELSLLSLVREDLKNPKDLLKTLQDLHSEANILRRRIESMEMKQATLVKKELLAELIPAGKYFFIGKVCEGLSPDALRKLAGELRQERPNLLLVLAVVSDSSSFVVIGLGDQVINETNLDASKIIKEMVVPQIGGGGGGQKMLASASGQNATHLDKVFDSVRSLFTA
jgi:alanyl-tRNA synthetase